MRCRSNYGLIPCPVCGVMFRVHPSNRTEISTCSHKCRGQIQQKRIELTCYQCGKPFERRPCHIISEHSLCSRECQQAYWTEQSRKNPKICTSIECICQMCGKSFRRQKSKVENFGGKYCSRECNSLSQVIPGTDGYRGPNWDQQRRLARKRDNYTCQTCGIHQKQYGKALDVHHIVPFRDFGVDNYLQANHLENLVSLCKTCHMLIERGNRTLDELKIHFLGPGPRIENRLDF